MAKLFSPPGKVSGVGGNKSPAPRGAAPKSSPSAASAVKNKFAAAGSVSGANGRTGQPPVESPPGKIPSDKPGKIGEEPTLMPEAESARSGGIMARVAPAPPGVLAEAPDPRASYQVGPSDDNSPLIKLTSSKAAPKPAASGIDVGGKEETNEPQPDKAGPSEAKAIPPTAKPSAAPDKEKM